MIPVFIGGCDRSGTTLLGSILGTNELCLTVPESQFKISVLKECKTGPNNLDILSAAKYINDNYRYKRWELNEKFLVSNRNLSGLRDYSDLLQLIVNEYAKKIGKRRCLHWIDHTPENLKYAATLVNIFHRAKFIHIIRDGRAVAASVMPLQWGPNNIDDAAKWWSRKILNCFAAEEYLRNMEIPLLRIKYEELLLYPAKIVKSIAGFLNIPYTDSMLLGDGFLLPEHTKEQHKLIGKPLDISRLDAWKSELYPEEVEHFESIVGDLLVHLGYQPIYGIKAKAADKELLRSFVKKEFKMRRVNYLRKALKWIIK